MDWNDMTQEQRDIEAIKYGAQMKQMKLSHEFGEAIQVLTERLLQAQKERADLLIAEDEAALGDGDLAAIRANLATLDGTLRTLESQIEAARQRRAAAAEAEDTEDLDALAEAAQAQAIDLADAYRKFGEAIETARRHLHAADALWRSLEGKNATLHAAGRKGHNTREIRRISMPEGERGPNGMTPVVVKADALLRSFLSPGGPLTGGLASALTASRARRTFAEAAEGSDNVR